MWRSCARLRSRIHLAVLQVKELCIVLRWWKVQGLCAMLRWSGTSGRRWTSWRACIRVASSSRAMEDNLGWRCRFQAPDSTAFCTERLGLKAWKKRACMAIAKVVEPIQWSDQKQVEAPWPRITEVFSLKVLVLHHCLLSMYNIAKLRCSFVFYPFSSFVLLIEPVSFSFWTFCLDIIFLYVGLIKDVKCAVHESWEVLVLVLTWKVLVLELTFSGISLPRMSSVLSTNIMHSGELAAWCAKLRNFVGHIFEPKHSIHLRIFNYVSPLVVLYSYSPCFPCPML